MSGIADGRRPAAAGLASAALCAVGALALHRLPRCRLNDEGGRVIRQTTLIIPARNEENNIPRLLASLRRQTTVPKRTLVVDDYSEDRTAQRVRDFGVEVVRPPEKPHDWTGKTWACRYGASIADSRYLLFVDADVWFEPDGLARIGSEAAAAPGVLSVLPYHVVTTVSEQFSSFFHILMMIGMGAFTTAGSRSGAAGLFGQCLLCTRDAYLAVGGHTRVHDRILENLSLGKAFREAGVPIRLFVGRGTLNVRMYPEGIAAVTAGWSKALVEGAEGSKPSMVAAGSAWIGGGLIATALLIGSRPARRLWPPLLYGLYVMEIAWMLRRLGSFRWFTALLFPLHCLFFCVVFAYSAVRVKLLGSVGWKGRTVERPSRRAREER